MSTLANTNNAHQLEAVKEDTIAAKENMQSNGINAPNSDRASSNSASTANLKTAPPATVNDVSLSHPTEATGIIPSYLPVVVEDSTVVVVATTEVAGSSTNMPPQQQQSETITVLPSYESSEESVYYKTAKALLQSGDFETALSTIEDGIEWTKQQFLLFKGGDHDHSSVSLEAATSSSETGTDSDTYTLHESMAPFHYMYGTTLLYSIEESTDGLQPLTTVEGGGDVQVPPDDDEQEDDDEEGPQYYANDEPNVDENQAVAVEDMEIAWENLDTARTILEQMLIVKPQSDKLRADMAQILLREGDLQRQNGAYTAAVADYTSCLSYSENNTLTPHYCRKIADVYCNLGAVHFTLVVETKKGPTPGQDMDGTGENNTAMEERDRPAKVIFYRNRGFYHYYECAKTLVGMIFKLSNSDPIECFQCIDSEHSIQFPYINERSEDYPKLIRFKLTMLRQVVTKLVKTMDVSSIDDSDLITDSLAVLEEIQETIDESEISEQGVVEATAMKEEITALVASQQHNNDDDASATTGTNNSNGNAFGSASATASTAKAQPIMIVKKKKKRTEEEIIDEDGMDVKLPAKANVNDTKRMKSSE